MQFLQSMRPLRNNGVDLLVEYLSSNITFYIEDG